MSQGGRGQGEEGFQVELRLYRRAEDALLVELCEAIRLGLAVCSAKGSELGDGTAPFGDDDALASLYMAKEAGKLVLGCGYVGSKYLAMLARTSDGSQR